MVSGAAFQFRPLPLSELLDETFRLYRRHFPLFASLSLALAVPGLLYTFLSGTYRASNLLELARSISTPDAVAQPPISPEQLPTFLAWSGIYGLAALLIVPFSLGVLFRATSGAVLGESPTFQSVLRQVLGRYWGLWGVGLLYGLFFLVNVTLVLIPLWIWIMVRWSVAIPALLTEGVGPARSLGRSWALVKGRWWRTCGILVVVYFLQSVLVYAVGALVLAVAALVPGLSRDFQSALVTAGTTVAGSIVGVVPFVAITLLYFDLRVRREAFDLDQLARQTGPAGAPESA